MPTEDANRRELERAAGDQWWVPHVCASAVCRKPLSNDPVTVLTTRHVRKFCSMFCVVDGHEESMRQAVEEGARWAEEEADDER